MTEDPFLGVASPGELLRLLRDGVPRTRTELTSATGLARSTVRNRLDALLDAGLVKKGPARHRPAGRFVFNPRARVVLAAEVGGHTRHRGGDRPDQLAARSAPHQAGRRRRSRCRPAGADRGREGVADRSRAGIDAASGRRHRSAGPGRAQDRATEQTPDHAGVGRLRRPRARHR
ncbi:helix-turn-helix domain-containing protein [Saccharothrix sp. S26]|uniref:helix-turn-helix domain-containing protein n=1 Tax=Saccharothrix sp. S26 TaxID=2907215 RepID=UPI0035AB75EC